MNCWYCGKEESEPNKAYNVEMFGDVNRDADDSGVESVSFKNKVVCVPRCNSCKAKQRKAKLFTFLSGLFLLGAIVLALLEVFSVSILASDWLRGFIVGIALMIAIAFFAFRVVKLKGIKTEKFSKKHYHEIKDLKTRGYEFGDSPKQKNTPKTVVENSDDKVEVVEE
jgi:hypothetical protein